MSSTSIAFAQNIAIMGSPGNASWNDDVESKLMGTGFFTNIDIYNLHLTTPSLAQMQSYDAILVYTDGAGGLDLVTFGNNLADYVDSGGGVVTAVFATASIPIQGRFNSENYWAIQPTSQQVSSEGLGTIFVPGHPILNGVSNFNGGSSSYRPSFDILNPNATRIANWTGAGNIPLIATRIIDETRRADIGFFPPSNDARSDFWDSTTDGDLILANALLWVANESIEPISIPTLSEWGMIIMSLILAGSAIWMMRRRQVS